MTLNMADVIILLFYIRRIRLYLPSSILLMMIFEKCRARDTVKKTVSNMRTPHEQTFIRSQKDIRTVIRWTILS